eukprot:Opistho-2@70282
MTDLFRIIAGSYDKVLYGFTCKATEKKDGLFVGIVPKFVYPPHSSCIKAVAASGRFLATGGSDETIRLYDLDRNSELGFLLQHQGSITSLQFHGTSHMLSGSEDGTLVIWRTKDWENLGVLRGHSAAVNSLSIHPTGRLALSVSRDKTMRTWNLVRGRSAYITRLKSEAEIVQWSPDGRRYLLVQDRRLSIYRVEDSEVIAEFESPKRILAATFVHNDRVAFGGEGHDIVVHEIESRKRTTIINGHTNRVRCLHTVPNPLASGALWLVSASSDGHIRMRNIEGQQLKAEQTAEDSIADENTRGRLTCLVAVPMTADEDSDATKSSLADAIGSEVVDKKTKAVRAREEEEDSENDSVDGDDAEEEDASEDLAPARGAKGGQKKSAKKVKSVDAAAVTKPPVKASANGGKTVGKKVAAAHGVKAQEGGRGKRKAGDASDAEEDARPAKKAKAVPIVKTQSQPPKQSQPQKQKQSQPQTQTQPQKQQQQAKAKSPVMQHKAASGASARKNGGGSVGKFTVVKKK